MFDWNKQAKTSAHIESDDDNRGFVKQNFLCDKAFECMLYIVSQTKCLIVRCLTAAH